MNDDDKFNAPQAGQKKYLDLSGTSNTGSSGSGKLQSMSKHSDRHFLCACLCAQNCSQIEETYSGHHDKKRKEKKFLEDQAYAAGAIIFSVAYIEATINEFFTDCESKTGNYQNFSLIDDSKIKKLVAYWNEKNPRGELVNRKRRTIPEKYLDAYKMVKGENQHYHSEYHQSIIELVNLRNRLIHYEPKWQNKDPDIDDPYQIKGLEGKFLLNKFLEKSGNPFFPDRCLGAGCSKWAVINSEKYVDEFFSIIGVKPMFFQVEDIRKDILGEF